MVELRCFKPRSMMVRQWGTEGCPSGNISLRDMLLPTSWQAAVVTSSFRGDLIISTGISAKNENAWHHSVQSDGSVTAYCTSCLRLSNSVEFEKAHESWMSARRPPWTSLGSDIVSSGRYYARSSGALCPPIRSRTTRFAH
jgi:hypothetical protein